MMQRVPVRIQDSKAWRLVVATAAALLFMLISLAVDTSPAFAQDATLTVSRSGGGTVTGPGIDCGSDCTEAYPITSERVCENDPETNVVICSNNPIYQDVTLTASTLSGWSFAGWGGECSGTATTCTLTMDADKAASASWTDVQNPSVSLTSPTGTNITGTTTVSANASDNDRVSSVQFFVGATSLGTDTAAPYSVSFNTAGFDGFRTFRAVATDPSGRTAEHNRMVMVDNTNPTLSFTGGPNGQTFGPGTTQTWTFTVGDAHSGVQSVRCKIDANPYGACSGGSTSHSVSNLPGGSHTFSVQVTDNVGRMIEGSRSFSIDATAPQTTITSGVADGGRTNQTTLTWGFSSSESAAFECRVYPSALTPPAFGACSAATSHTAAGFSPGTYTFEVRATDALGNIDGSPAKRTFTIDTTKPVVKSVSPRHLAKGVAPTVNVTATFSEAMNRATLNRTTFKLVKKGTRVPVAATVSYSGNRATLNPSRSLVRGATYTATVTTGAKDLAGNPLSVTKVWRFTVRR